MKDFKIIKIFDIETGNGEFGEWVSREIVVEEIDDSVENPNQILLRMKGDVARNFNLAVGDIVEFAYATRVHTFTVKKGTPEEKVRASMECRCWKITKKEPMLL